MIKSRESNYFCMEIFVFGNKKQFGEIEKKVSPRHGVSQISAISDLPEELELVVFDFSMEDSPENIEDYSAFENLHLFVNATRGSLAELAYFSEGPIPNLFGFAGDPTFIEREILEVSAFHGNKSKAKEILKKIGIKGAQVDDRVGLVTPRIIAMIINEAYYTVQEGTASRQDIDLGMKLGTNYPMGPFEWARQWGLNNVYELLDALYLDTREERYKICPLLKKEYLKGA